MNGDIGIGKLIKQERHRDAIHVAVAPVEAGEDLEPGAPVAIVEGKAVRSSRKPIGIVDPFLSLEWTQIKKGDKFYLFLIPGSITSLRHEWEHPAFQPVAVPPTQDKAASEKWLREYAAKVNSYIADDNGEEAAYERLMDDIRGGNNITYIGSDMHGLGDLREPDELKRHAEIVLGIKIDWGTFEYFGCSC